MKKIICYFTLLFIVVGCKQEIPNAQPTPGKIFTNSIGMKLVYIPHGEFMMGSRDTVEEVTKGTNAKRGTNAKPEHFTNEHPQHIVKITNGFFMGSTEVSQAQYVAIMGTNPSEFTGEDNPVEKVSWDDAVGFCKKLSEKEGKEYRLPTEAEWEYACRAGTTTPFYTGETISTSHANYDGNYVYGNGATGVYRKKTTSVGSFPPNAFGLYDMHGNVFEWCNDRYAKAYTFTDNVNPQGPDSGVFRVLRDGSWCFNPGFCRSANRRGSAPDSRSDVCGFRILLDL